MTERGDYRLTPEVVPLAIREASQKAILAVGLGAGSFVPMRSSKHFGPPVYLMGGLMIALPTIDLLLSVSPMRFGAAAWRFGAGGILTKGLLTPFLGLMIWFMAAWFLEHRVMLRVLAAIAAVASILLVLMSVSFALDALQMRPQVVPGAARTFAFTVATTLLKDAAFFVAALVLASSAWKAGRRPSGEREHSRMLIHDTPVSAGPTPAL